MPVCVSVPAVPHAPVSAQATVIEQPPGKTVVRVSWEPDKNGTAPVWYNLDLWSNLMYEQSLNVLGVSSSVEVCVMQCYI